MAEGTPPSHGGSNAGEWTPYTGLLSEGFPSGFDTRSDEHFQGLDDEDLVNITDELHRVYTDVVGTTADVTYVLLNYPDELDKAEVATAEDIGVARNVIREAIRRAAQNPAWGLTPEYLFGDQTQAEGGAK